jgi:hypothetical protein
VHGINRSSESAGSPRGLEAARIKLPPAVKLPPNRRLLWREVVRDEMEDPFSPLEIESVVRASVRGWAVPVDIERVLDASLRTILVLVIEVVLLDPPLVLHIDTSLLYA